MWFVDPASKAKCRRLNVHSRNDIMVTGPNLKILKLASPKVTMFSYIHPMLLSCLRNSNFLIPSNEQSLL